MTERFEQEFYTSAWRRVLPLGPYGIQPYVRPARRRRGAVGLPRLGASIGRTLERITKFGGWAAVGLSKRPMLEGGSPPRHAPPGAARGKRSGRAPPQPLRKGGLDRSLGGPAVPARSPSRLPTDDTLGGGGAGAAAGAS